MILLIDNYDSFTFNLVHYLSELGAECDVRRNDALTAEEALATDPEAIVLSPGPCTPDEAGICCDLIRMAAPRGVPVLGVCLGHQAIGQVFGAQVIRAPSPVHGKINPVLHDGKGLFASLPSPFQATRYHSLVLDPASIPDCLERTARTEDNIIMGVEHKEFPLYGVQFHPESIASEYGHRILDNFLTLARRRNASRPASKMDAM
ncbi:aminodeoxychorismate/anthranilate synthase component II [Acetobacter sp. AN02]|uniref:anthranilate synthase component II n=1 Tax=Acetobacter sp. AN02 TaxID=2894186 RepID=UPI00243419F8|nr:aminodeoxychorismate/anthranilate synthase component II [Acetobacter sp. AN02]MDG6093689.1 aminodeoxychorismate/anthranilate synthase component II [Acetobacter sp. AN02]